ncbi:MAG: hypothetical protein WA421_01005 [Nitrososphaeraceae archaeon]
MLKFSLKTVEVFLDFAYDISTFQQIPPPHSVENGMPAFDGGDTAAIGGATHFTIYPLKETQILLLLAAKK